ncbi:MAG: PAS domain S-box protein [Gemmatimonadaceae bacterium]|nr:PAS domain S-box protein [Gemmatimonadaceae bacterium]
MPHTPYTAQQLRAVVESSPIGLLMVDHRGRIVLVNAEVERLFGYAREAMYGQSVELLLPERSRGAHPALRDDFVTDPTARRMGAGRELSARRADGSEFPVEIGLTPVATEDGIFVVASIVDITERLAAARERDWLEAQLRQSQKMEALGTLAGGVAHDFNNVLASIVGLGELVLRAVGDRPQVEEDVRDLLTAAHRGRELVERILRFSRRQSVKMSPLDLGDTMAHSARLLRASLPPNVRIELTLLPMRRRMRGDATSLQQVVMNLATNSAQAMPDGGTLIIALDEVYLHDSLARSRAAAREGRYLRLTVRDNGHGMDEATRLKAFEPFFTTKPVGTGSGLGLALVHGIVHDHEGVIEMESSPGVGTIVHCLFPAIEEDAGQDLSASDAVPRGNGEWLLYVDDESTLVKIGERQLERMGYRVMGCADPREALVALNARQGSSEAFAAIVTDYLMPGMTGLEFAAAVRAAGVTVPILVLSGFIGDFAPQALADGGISEVLQKPVGAEVLAQAVHRAIAGG